MRLIHCADIHLDSKLSANLEGEKKKKRRSELLESFLNMVEWAVVNMVDGIMISGDLFDTANISKTTAGYIQKCIKDNPQITFYYLKGNHDICSFLYEMEEEYPNLKMFGDEWTEYVLGEGENIVIKGVELNPQNSSTIYNSLVLEPGNFNIVMLHGQNAAYQSKDRAEVISLSNLKNKSIDYLALGHIHGFEEGKLDGRGNYCYPGCLEGRGFDECGQHGFVLIDIDEQNMSSSRRFVPWGVRQLYEIEADISGCMDTDGALRRIRQYIRECGADSKDMLKVILNGELDDEAEISTDFITHKLEEEYFFIKLKDLSRIRVDMGRYVNDISLKGEFIRMVMADTALDEITKAEIIKTGLAALCGEDF